MNSFQKNTNPLVSMEIGDPWKRIKPGMKIRIIKDFSMSYRTNHITSYSRSPIKFKKGPILEIAGVWKTWIEKLPILNGYEAEEFTIGINRGPFGNRGIRSNISEFKKYIELIDE
jgi:hypothetical protein